MDIAKTIITKSPKETSRLGQALSSSLKEGTGAGVVCLYGELGSGKTTFVQGFAKGLGIHRRIPSPTFIIVRRYEIPNSPGYLYHLDLYRIDSETELEDLGISEMIRDTHSYMIIEWAEKMGNLLPQERTDVRFRVQPDGNHQVSIQQHG